MKTLLPKTQDMPEISVVPYMALLSLLFLAGALAGCLTSAYIDEYTGQNVNHFFDNLLKILNDQSLPTISFGRALLNTYIYHLIVVCFAFTVVGVAVAPCVIIAKGFLISLTVSSFVKALGLKGLWLAVAALGVQALIVLPCLFLVSIVALQKSISLFRNAIHKPISAGSFCVKFSWLFVIALLLFIAAVYEAFVSPYFMVWVASW